MCHYSVIFKAVPSLLIITVLCVQIINALVPLQLPNRTEISSDNGTNLTKVAWNATNSGADCFPDGPEQWAVLDRADCEEAIDLIPDIPFALLSEQPRRFSSCKQPRPRVRPCSGMRVYGSLLLSLRSKSG